MTDNAYKINCPRCKSRNTGVIDTRLNYKKHKRRRRICRTCEHRWTTYEISKEEYLDMLENKMADKLLVSRLQELINEFK